MDAEAFEHFKAYRHYTVSAADSQPNDLRCQLDVAMAEITTIELFGADSWSTFENSANRIIHVLRDLPPNDITLCQAVSRGLLACAQIALAYQRRDGAEEYLHYSNVIHQILGQPILPFAIP